MKHETKKFKENDLVRIVDALGDEADNIGIETFITGKRYDWTGTQIGYKLEGVDKKKGWRGHPVYYDENLELVENPSFRKGDFVKINLDCPIGNLFENNIPCSFIGTRMLMSGNIKFDSTMEYRVKEVHMKHGDRGLVVEGLGKYNLINDYMFTLVRRPKLVKKDNMIEVAKNSAAK